MSKLIDVLNYDDEIFMDYGGENTRTGKYFSTKVSREWFEKNHEELSKADVPLSDENYNKLKSIDKFWKMTAEKWREEGKI